MEFDNSLEILRQGMSYNKNSIVQLISDVRFILQVLVPGNHLFFFACDMSLQRDRENPILVRPFLCLPEYRCGVEAV